MKKDIHYITKKIMLLFFSFVFMVSFSACGNEYAKGEVSVYSFSSDRDDIVEKRIRLKEESSINSIQEITKILDPEDKSEADTDLLTDGFAILEAYYEDSNAVINMSSDFYSLPKQQAFLALAGMTCTYTSVDGISGVSFLVEDEPLRNDKGEEYGIKTKEDYILYDELINGDENKIEISLYFADSMGNSLLESKRNMIIENGESKEKMILEQLILGPDGEDCYPTINPDARVNSVSVENGVCSIDLSEEFMSQIYNISADVAIYSVVNTLTKLNNINRVIISVDGKRDVSFESKYSFSEPFEFNTSLVQ